MRHELVSTGMLCDLCQFPFFFSHFQKQISILLLVCFGLLDFPTLARFSSFFSSIFLLFGTCESLQGNDKMNLLKEGERERERDFIEKEKNCKLGSEN